MSALVLRLALAGLLAGAALLALASGELPRSAGFVAKSAVCFCAVVGLLAWGLRRWCGPRKADEILSRLVLLGAGFALALAFAEAVVRIVYRDVETTSDFSSYFSRRWKEGVRSNRYGFRERDFEPAKAPGIFRIAVIGDSFTYGPGIAEEERFSRRLETALNARIEGAVQFEVLNFGRPGAATEDHIEILIDPVSTLDPDFVLLQWYRNDVEGRGLVGRPQPMRLVPSDSLARILHQHSALYYLLVLRWNELQGALGWVESYADYMRGRFLDPESPDSRAARDSLARFVDTARERGFGVGIVVFPALWGRDEFDYLRARVLQFCASRGVPCLDLENALGADGRALWVNAFDSHPGAEANAIAARAIEERFAPLWLGGAP